MTPAGAEKGKNLRVGDLVEIPEIKTVIQLRDLEDRRWRHLIVDTFVVTAEVGDNLKAIFTSLAELQGRGVLLKGHFGSGKSHFLSLCSMVLGEPRFWPALISQDPSLEAYADKLRAHRFLVVEISLVEHRSAEFLEDIILQAIFKELRRLRGHAFEGGETRQETFDRLRLAMGELGYDGMVLVVDELSEFLRAKPDARSFNEDIRFLQYLGELAASFPLWLIAALQEWIEETGEIHQETFNKIKDRYRLRLNLGRAHIEELVSQRLIRRKEGAAEIIAGIYGDIKKYFDTFPVSSERFLRLYPVHPATTALLDRLKPLFSEHRGVVDFIHYRLKGDPERHIPSFLERPADELLTPEVIFDHFLDRIRERSESQIYVERVYVAYEEEVERMFPDAEQRRLALAAVKLLILFAISPVKFRYTVRHLAEMILYRVTPMDAEINYQFLQDILDRLAAEGSYIRAAKGADPLENHYYIDLQADIAGITRRRVRHLATEIFAEDRRLFTKLGELVHTQHLPLAGWLEHGRQQVGLKWQHTKRRGLLFLRQLDEVNPEELEDLAARWQRSEDDFFVFVGTTHECQAQLEHVRRRLLPRLRENCGGMFLFWVPAAAGGDDSWLREALAAVILLQTVQEEGAAGRSREQAREYLQHLVEGYKRRLADYFTERYFQGVLLGDERQVELASFGYLSQEKFLEEFVPPLLGRRFPRHGRIHPYLEAPAPALLAGMLLEFFAAGLVAIDARSKFTVRNLLEGLLKPMGLVRKKGNQYLLHVDPRRNELVQAFFAGIGSRPMPVEELYWRLRKGDYGLSRPQFELMVMALLCSGHLVAYQGGRRKGVEEVVRRGLGCLSAVGRGEILAEEWRQLLAVHPLAPEGYRKMPLTLASQEELWGELKGAKGEQLRRLQALRAKVEWAAKFKALEKLPWERCRKSIQALISQWEEVKVSLPSREGLERFLASGQEAEVLAAHLAVVEQAAEFLASAERVLFIHQYVSDPRLHLPADDAYASLRQQRQAVLDWFQAGKFLDGSGLAELFSGFQRFQDDYIRVYVEAHRQARTEGSFAAYEKLSRSARYQVLKRFSQLEMISVEHDCRSIDQALAAVLQYRCRQSPQEFLQGQPLCPCGFRLGERLEFKPLPELNREIDQGIKETLAALRSRPVQEKLVPHLESLELVGKRREAVAVRRLLDTAASGAEGEELRRRLQEALTSEVIREINAAFRGKVVVVKRNLDELYRALIHRKYTLSQVREILRAWLREEEVAADTFVHFVGSEQGGGRAAPIEEFVQYFRDQTPHLHPLLAEVEPRQLIQAILACGWAGAHGIDLGEVAGSFAFLRRGTPADGVRLAAQLGETAAVLRRQRPELFESLVAMAEEDASFLEGLWSQLAARSPAEIFRREQVFPRVLQAAFERLLGLLEQGELSLEMVAAEDDLGESGPGFRERRQEMVDALGCWLTLQGHRQSLRQPAAKEAKDFRKWEKVYVREMSAIPVLLDRIRTLLRLSHTEIPPFVREEERELRHRLLQLSTAFGKFYDEFSRGWEQGEGTRPARIEDVPGLVRRQRSVPEHQRCLYLLMDGMRWDLWEVIKRDFFGKMEDRFLVGREGVLWARTPTNTATQLPYLEEALAAAHPEAAVDEVLWKVGGIDQRLHSEKGDLGSLFANVLRHLELDLYYRLRDLPAGTLMILVADHGFVENPAFSSAAKYEAERFTHGGTSPFEVLVPWAWVFRL